MSSPTPPPSPPAPPPTVDGPTLSFGMGLRNVVPSVLKGVRALMPEVQLKGFQLAWGVLFVIFVFGSALIYVVARTEFVTPPPEIQTVTKLIEQAAATATAASAPEVLKQANELMTRLAESRRASRDFWTSFSQFLLLNLLLPVLTAILGYIFGTMKGKEEEPPRGDPPGS